ncbi:Raftlin [Oryzias melastigma]|uniref:Raftlin n=1 Tax=Oryzias melastigma TaxID=30732 RepID=A0A834BY17_ORYME|nr:raftlin isoform X1 [Oryzias melastigma]XP_024113585.1 raftlin isoform X1 [Oryzias melastigma]KAF6716715.1 Raftlin [Oryzias melastigma]
MGCRLPKLRKAEDRHSPGNIYSTLRRPQVETKVGVAYTYHFLDFLLGKEEVPVSSVLCLSSVRELPVQVRELYAQGFVLVAVHPFVHPCGPRHAHIQRQLHRAVLVRETPSLEKNQWRCSRSRLETDICVAGQQAADPEVIQSYVKRIQDVAEQGVTFVGFLQQPGGGLYISGHWDPEELSSLHSSPSPIHRHPFSSNASPTDPEDLNGINAEFELDLDAPKRSKQDQNTSEKDSNKHVQSEPQGYAKADSGPLQDDLTEKALTQQEWPLSEGKQNFPETYFNLSNSRQRRCSTSDSWLSSPELDGRRDRKSMNTESRGMTHNNNNHIRLKGSHRDKSANSPQPRDRMQLFALYNHSEEPNSSLRFYALRVPLRVQKDAGLITEVDANWLDHMTQHFSSGARLIDGFFHLTDDNESGVSSVDSVFIFQRSAEETSYDAIVVEQWTVVDGVVVKTDYIPLLQSLAPYGWRLMCVLPTPIVKTNSDGSLSTKQILFLQRPVLQRKRKDFKKLNLRGRNKAKKSSAGEALDEQENRSLVMETEMDRLRLGADEEEEEDEGSGRRASLQRREEDAQHQRSFLLERRASDEHREEETDVDESPLSKLEKSVRWTDFCQKCDGGVKEEVRGEERIKQQLFSGVC